MAVAADNIGGNAVLTEVVHRIVDALAPDRIYLFGSMARGESHYDSDYDLLVVVDECAIPAYKLSQKAHSALWGLKIAVDVLVWPKESFEQRITLQSSLPATVMREGKLLYAA
ncbi:MAG TPA: nucleotidyltransferase domain-containing protein [Candidatus Hydrogenedentes bacterium]|nr:nucleotidyltransferase domain-containing protein [Candidatus Hydrogenedentota bacterium]